MNNKILKTTFYTIEIVKLYRVTFDFRIIIMKKKIEKLKQNKKQK
jgi:hypothetical protein